jgi:pimeloyl-ACP methyl ester carboxylesterase
VRAPEKFGHDPAYPVTSNWPHLVQQLADFAAPEIQRHGQGAWLVGHSLGGFLSLMCAARYPQLGGQAIQGVLLIDSPVLGGWRARALELAKRTQLVGSISPGKISRKRRNAWPDAQAAFDHFAHKKAFARWDPQVLRDYIAHGTHDDTAAQGPRRVLGFDREVETAIYNTLPHNLDRLLRRHPLQCPVGFIGGTASLEMKQVGMAMTHKLVGADHPERLLGGGRQPPVSDGATAGNRRRHRGRAQGHARWCRYQGLSPGVHPGNPASPNNTALATMAGT